MRWPGFIGASGVAQSVIADAEDTVNWYVEKAQQPDLKNSMALYPSPGFSPILTVTPDVGARATCNAGGRCFFIIGGGLYEITSGPWAYTYRGAVMQDSNRAQMFYNGQVGGQLGIASGGNFYSYILATNTLALQLNGICTQTAYAAGFFFAFNINTGRVLVSALNDGTSWNLGNFFQRSLFPDPYQAIFVDGNNLLWTVGTESFEVRYNTGVGNQPWAPLQGLSGLQGICAPFAFFTGTGGNGWLSASKQGIGEILLTGGSYPTAVSTYAFATAMANYLRANPAALATSEAWSYQQEGHTFGLFSLPRVPSTWCYDIEGNSPTRRGLWNPVTGDWGLWTPRVHVSAFGYHLVGGWTSAAICIMDTNLATEFDGETGIVRERTTPGMTNEHARIPIDQVELLMDVGLAPQTGPGSNPVATLRVSEDGGRTYGNMLQAGIGRAGEWRHRVYWNNLGAPADAVFKVRTSDPCPTRIVDCWINNVEPQR